MIHQGRSRAGEKIKDFGFGLDKFEVPIRYLSGEFKRAVGYKCLKNGEISKGEKIG